MKLSFRLTVNLEDTWAGDAFTKDFIGDFDLDLSLFFWCIWRLGDASRFDL